MPEARLLLPYGVAGANPFELPGAVRADPRTFDSDLPVVLAVPSLHHLLQAEWLQTVRERAWVSHESWVESASSAAGPTGAATWRYADVLRSWSEAVDPARIHLVAGPEPAVRDAIARLTGHPLPSSLRPWPRILSGPEIRMVDRVLTELTELGLVGRNAAELVHGGVLRTLGDQGGELRGTDALAPSVRARLEQFAKRMLDEVDALGIEILGDRSALTLTDAPTGLEEPGGGQPLVSVQRAGRLATSILEQAMTWTPEADS